MNRQAHLSPHDLRRKLLDHAHDPAASMDAARGQDEDVDSEFERLVLRDLKMKGYRVATQWKVGSYRIDLVVEGVRERLAIECDGDRFHTIESLQAEMQCTFVPTALLLDGLVRSCRASPDWDAPPI